MISDSIQNRFWSKVKVGHSDDCWRWTGARGGQMGYGRMQFRKPGEFIYAHQLSLLIAGKDRPEGKIALHSCDNPWCVNPRHLRWGTQKENMRDALSRGRAPHHGRVAGEKNGNAKLDASQARTIRQSNLPQAKLASQFGISTSLVSAIKNGAAWRHLWDEPE